MLSPFLEKQKFAVVDAGEDCDGTARAADWTMFSDRSVLVNMCCVGMGTALGERGVDTGSILWSVSGLIEDQGERDTAAVHSDFLKAGADVLLTNSYKVGGSV